MRLGLVCLCSAATKAAALKTKERMLARSNSLDPDIERCQDSSYDLDQVGTKHARLFVCCSGCGLFIMIIIMFFWWLPGLVVPVASWKKLGLKPECHRACDACTPGHSCVPCTDKDPCEDATNFSATVGIVWIGYGAFVVLFNVIILTVVACCWRTKVPKLDDAGTKLTPLLSTLQNQGTMSEC